MINLGRYPGTDVPNVKAQPRMIDWVMDAVSILMWIAIVCITIIYRQELAGVKEGKGFILPGISTLITLLFLWSTRAPIRYFNFPVRVTERNYVTQYLLATRMCRVISIQINASFLLTMIGKTMILDAPSKDYLSMTSALLIGLVLISVIIYYLIARRYRG